MTPWRWLLIAVFAIGLLASVFSSTNTTVPPIQWRDLPLAFVGCAFGMLFIIGIQLLRRDPRPARFGFRFMITAALFFVASGVGSSTLAALRGGVTPEPFLLLAIGCGAFAGLGLVRIAFLRRFGVSP